MTPPSLSKLAEIENEWRAWLKDNPRAPEFERHYAMGVIDALKYAAGGDPFAFVMFWEEWYDIDSGC